MVLWATDRPRPMTEDEKTFFIRLGANIAAARHEHGLTQARIAQELGVSQQTVNSFEKGRRRVPVSALPDLAKLLDMSIEELIEGKKEKRAERRGPASKLQRQIEEIRRLPRAKQRFVIEILDTVIAQAHRAPSGA